MNQADDYAIVILEPESVWWVRQLRAFQRYARRFNQFHPGRKVAWFRLNRQQRRAAMIDFLDTTIVDRRMATALVNRYFYLVNSGRLR